MPQSFWSTYSTECVTQSRETKACTNTGPVLQTELRVFWSPPGTFRGLRSFSSLLCCSTCRSMVVCPLRFQNVSQSHVFISLSVWSATLELEPLYVWILEYHIIISSAGYIRSTRELKKTNKETKQYRSIIARRWPFRVRTQTGRSPLTSLFQYKSTLIKTVLQTQNNKNNWG